jgi:DNA polymerase-3 subunit epsilon
MTILDRPLADMEFVALDTETNGCAGPACEMTEVGAVLLGGGELHDRFDSLVTVRRPLGSGIQRFTGITQAMVDAAPGPDDVLPRLAELLDGRVLVAHSASFDVRVLRVAFERAGMRWPAPPALCTVALARRCAPLIRQRRLAALAAALDVDVTVTHRALADAETCGRIFCALLPRLARDAATVGEAVALLGPRRRRAPRRPRERIAADGRTVMPEGLDFTTLPTGPGVYVYRDGLGRPLYVGKSMTVRRRARSHFHPGRRAGWSAHAVSVEGTATGSELGALVLENRLIKSLKPPGNVALARIDRFAYLRCRLDIAFPVLEVATEPAAGHAVNIGPLRSPFAARELVDQLEALFGLRRCGRKLPRREHPSLYGQMGRCASPCLGDLDPNAYRRKLDGALALFNAPAGAREGLLAHVDTEMRDAAAAQRYERAEVLRRRRARLLELLDRIGGILRATHAAPRLVLVPGPKAADAFWLVGGHVADWGLAPEDPDELTRRGAAALASRPTAGSVVVVAPDAVDELRIVANWLAGHELEVVEIPLDPEPEPDVLADAVLFAAA